MTIYTHVPEIIQIRQYIRNYTNWRRTVLEVYFLSHLWKILLNLTWAGNSCIIDIEINAWSPLFANLEINLIFNWYKRRCLKCNQSECNFQNPNSQLESGIFHALSERASIGWNLAGISKKEDQAEN